MDDIIDALKKWDNVGYMDSPKTPDSWQWHFLQAMNEALCSFRAHGCASAESAPRTGLILHGHPGRESQFQWADLKDEEQVRPIIHGQKYGDACSAIIYWQQVSLSMNTVEHFLLLYASLFCLYLAQVIFYATQAVKFVCFSRLMVEMCVVDNYEARTAQNLGASSCPTPVFPRYDADPPSATMRRDFIGNFC